MFNFPPEALISSDVCSEQERAQGTHLSLFLGSLVFLFPYIFHENCLIFLQYLSGKISNQLISQLQPTKLVTANSMIVSKQVGVMLKIKVRESSLVILFLLQSYSLFTNHASYSVSTICFLIIFSSYPIFLFFSLYPISFLYLFHSQQATYLLSFLTILLYHFQSLYSYFIIFKNSQSCFL